MRMMWVLLWAVVGCGEAGGGGTTPSGAGEAGAGQGVAGAGQGVAGAGEAGAGEAGAGQGEAGAGEAGAGQGEAGAGEAGAGQGVAGAGEADGLGSPREPLAVANAVDEKTLERSPGLTPAMPLVKVAAPSAVPGLAGAPGESPAMGPSDALVKVFVFSDFQCPVCRRAVEPLKKLVRTFPDEVQVIFKHHALANHARAEPAARMTLAALRQGRFWEVHDRLFEQQRALDDANLRAQAIAAGCDAAQLDKDLADPALAAQIAYESAQAQALDAMGTPAYLVNGGLTVGWGSYIGLESQVRQALEEARRLLAEGTPRAEVARRATAMKHPQAEAILWGP